jgi:hypothetical protein
MTRTLISVAAIALIGVFALARLTWGFTLLTAEAARRQSVAAAPIA